MRDVLTRLWPEPHRQPLPECHRGCAQRSSRQTLPSARRIVTGLTTISAWKTVFAVRRSGTRRDNHGRKLGRMLRPRQNQLALPRQCSSGRRVCRPTSLQSRRITSSPTRFAPTRRQAIGDEPPLRLRCVVKTSNVVPLEKILIASTWRAHRRLGDSGQCGVKQRLHHKDAVRHHFATENRRLNGHGQKRPP